MTKEFKGQFQLVYGVCKPGDITTRDLARPEYFDSMKRTEAALQKHADFYGTIEYQLWATSIAEWNGKQYVDERIGGKLVE